MMTSPHTPDDLDRGMGGGEKGHTSERVPGAL